MSAKNIKNRLKRMILTSALSVPFLISMGVLFAWIGGLVFGSSVGTDGKEYVNHGGIVMLAAFVSTVLFAVWFYRFLNKKSKVNE